MLYEALTGRVPFEAETPVAVALKQISEPPRPPSQLNPQVPPALDAVVLRALAKDPAARYQTRRRVPAGARRGRGRSRRSPAAVVAARAAEAEDERPWWTPARG